MRSSCKSAPLIACGLALMVTLLLPIPRSAAAGERIDSIFERANAAYYAGNYDSAIARYQRLLEAGIDDPDLHYNLAVTYARAQRYGRAVLCFERVLRLQPGDEDARRGVAAARDALAQRRAEADGDGGVGGGPSLGQTLVEPFTASGLAWIVLLADIALFGLLLARRAVRAEAGRLALAIAAPLTGMLLLLSSLGLAVKTDALQDGSPAVVVEPESPVHAGPDPRAQLRARAHEGERARVLEQHGGFVRVKLPGGREGWMRAGDVGVI